MVARTFWDAGGGFGESPVYTGGVLRRTHPRGRLYASAKGVWLEVPLAKPALQRLVGEAVGKSGLDEAYIRLLVTRGVGDLGLDPRKCPKPFVICIVDTLQLWPQGRYDNGLDAF